MEFVLIQMLNLVLIILLREKNVIIFGADMSFSSHSTNKTKYLFFKKRFCSRNKQHNNISRKNLQN